MNTCVLLLFFCYVNCNVYNSTLKLVHVFFRHGSRIPDEHELYSNDPYIDIFRQHGFGQLTKKGKQGSYELGKFLRKRYNSFLGQEFENEIVLARSTDSDRTKMTALLVLAGLFPPSNNSRWSDNVNWIPIPYSYDKDDIDYNLRRPNFYCPAYLTELNRVLESDDVKNVLIEYKKTFEHSSNFTGKMYRTLRDVFLLRQLLHTEENMNLTLPAWAAVEYPNICYLAIMQCYFENSNTVLRKLNGGRMLTRVLDNMKKKVERTLQPPKRKIFLYSGHDSNIVSILSGLYLYEAHFPNYNSAVSMELHYDHNTKDHFVKVFYIQDVSTEPNALHIKDCGGDWCQLEKFEELLLPHLPMNYTEECESNIALD